MTHTIQIRNVGYECCGRLFGHDLPVPGRVHAHVSSPETTRFDRHLGTNVLTTVCGRRVVATRAEISPAAEGPAVTCRRCLRVIRRS
jgi:hypothetical protein